MGGVAGAEPAPRRGDVWDADLDSAVGHEQGKVRPVLVVSYDCEQIRVLSYGRLIRRRGAVSRATLHAVGTRLRLLLDLWGRASRNGRPRQPISANAAGRELAHTSS